MRPSKPRLDITPVIVHRAVRAFWLRQSRMHYLSPHEASSAAIAAGSRSCEPRTWPRGGETHERHLIAEAGLGADQAFHVVVRQGAAFFALFPWPPNVLGRVRP
jgi:hypothetical protein